MPFRLRNYISNSFHFTKTLKLVMKPPIFPPKKRKSQHEGDDL